MLYNLSVEFDSRIDSNVRCVKHARYDERDNPNPAFWTVYLQTVKMKDGFLDTMGDVHRYTFADSEIPTLMDTLLKYLEWYREMGMPHDNPVIQLTAVT